MTVDICTAEMVSAADFRKGMRKLAAAVNVISTDLDGELHGLLATAVCSVSDDPPTLLVCVNQRATACTPIATSKRFCVSVLSHGQFDLAQKFLTVQSTERLNLCKWQRLSTGAPAIQGALVNFDCEVAQVVDAGTHTIYMGRVVAATFADTDAPLLYFDGKYAGLAPVTQL
ncbi:flavin reductase family protein [Rhodobacteraceae bacterium KMM 6894]|nr:flavin reductase family protein [Rhodobacteraceae bacterium KMM 6894]